MLRKTLIVLGFTAALVAPGVTVPASAAPATDLEKTVLTLLNKQRAQNGLPKLTRNVKLVNAALGHNQRMAAAGTLSHQLPGEPSFDQRITNAGYTWSSAAENIGVTTDTSSAGAIAIQKAFFHEVPPNDGHRRNILSTSVTEVGISVYVSGGKLWITEDFAAPQ